MKFAFFVESFGHQHDSTEWRLCTDSSKISLKVVLQLNGNKIPSLPLAHAANLKESYENIKLLLERIQYEKYNWNICEDLKVIAVLLGLQLEYKKIS